MSREPNAIRVVLVDDHPMVLHGLAGLLRDEGFDVVGIGATAVEALEALARSPADLIVVDLTLEAESGFDVLASVQAEFPAVKTVVYSVHEDVLHVRRALQSGAMGYVTKREDPEVLMQCLQQVQGGERFLSPRAALALADAVAKRSEQAPDQVLSVQEMQVYELLGKGFGTPDIAKRMGISGRTVETYYSRILVKLDLPGRRALRRHASQHAQATLAK